MIYLLIHVKRLIIFFTQRGTNVRNIDYSLVTASALSWMTLSNLF